MEYGVPVMTSASASQLIESFDALESQGTRQMIADAYQSVRADYSLESIAKRYREWLLSRF